MLLEVTRNSSIKVMMEVNVRSEAYSIGFNLSFALKKYIVGNPFTSTPLAATSFIEASILAISIPLS